MQKLVKQQIDKASYNLIIRGISWSFEIMTTDGQDIKSEAITSRAKQKARIIQGFKIYFTIYNKQSLKFQKDFHVNGWYIE